MKNKPNKNTKNIEDWRQKVQPSFEDIYPEAFIIEEELEEVSEEWADIIYEKDEISM